MHPKVTQVSRKIRKTDFQQCQGSIDKCSKDWCGWSSGFNFRATGRNQVIVVRTVSDFWRFILSLFAWLWCSSW